MSKFSDSEALDAAPVGQLTASPTQTDLLPQESDSSSWRKEVSERLNRYHARRRPRAPRYPSLRLKFESQSNWTSSSGESPAISPAQSVPTSQPATRHAVAVHYPDLAPLSETVFEPQAQPTVIPEPRQPEPSAKIIEFPRTAYAPPIRVYELAEPILDRPRILEAPEVVPPPPALGGITIEQAEKPEPERRPGIDMPLRSAPARQQLMATITDAVIVLAATATFAAVFYRIAGIRPPLVQIMEVGAVLLGLFAFAYYYLMLVHSGTTLGLRALKLEVRRFDGHPPNRRNRRARVLCGLLSASALGLGYAWRFLDEDGLCWHERVTKTHIASQAQE